MERSANQYENQQVSNRFEKRHADVMLRLRSNGGLVGYRLPHSDRYGAKFYFGKALQWHIEQLPWHEYLAMTNWWMKIQPRRHWILG